MSFFSIEGSFFLIENIFNTFNYDDIISPMSEPSLTNKMCTI